VSRYDHAQKPEPAESVNPINHEIVDISRRQVILGGAAMVAAMSLPMAASALQPKTAIPPKSHGRKQGAKDMNMFETKDGTSIFYKDWGTGPVVTFSHGWPLSSDA
jgi:non-heme chloroperoxidase